MRRYIVLLLITGIVWAQTDYDKLVLKNGKEYLGEYVKTEKDKVYFNSNEEYVFPLVRGRIKLFQLEKALGMRDELLALSLLKELIPEWTKTDSEKYSRN